MRGARLRSAERRFVGGMAGVMLGLVVASAGVAPAQAQQRPDWSAELWATEGGEQLVAVAYTREAGDEELVPALTVMCGDPLWLRYEPGLNGVDETDRSGQTASFSFSFGQGSIERVLQYEAMDGNWTTMLEAGDELLAALQAGKEVAVSGGELPEQVFSLRGATAAIRDVRRSCR